MGRILPAILCAAAWAVFGFSGAAAQDQQAPAANLELLTQDTKVAADGSFTQTIHAELKAANEAGALQISRINLPFSAGLQTIEVVEAYTWKADGRKIPIDPATVFEQLPQDAAQSGMVTDQRIKILFFPQFSAGDKAVYTVRMTTAHPHFPGAFFAGEIFPRIISYKEVRATITAPKSMGLRVENHDVSFSKKDSGSDTVYSWHYAAPTTKKLETVLVSPIDREPRFFISSFKDYAELGRAYAALATPKIAVTPKVAALAEQVAGGEKDRKEQARKLYEWVVHNIRYVGIELGHGSFVPHDVDAILANGYGDCKDHDVLLQALLKAKNIDAESVLINSSNSYTLTEAPTFTQLDHVITFVPEFNVYLDASVPVAPFGVLPLAEYGKPAVRLTAKTASPITMPLLKPGMTSIHTVTAQKLETNGNLSGTTTTTATGPYALGLRLIGFAVQGAGAEKAAEYQLSARGFKDGTGKLIEDPPTVLGERYSIRGEFVVKGWDSVLHGEGTIMPGGLRVLAKTGDGMMGPADNSDNLINEATACYSANADEDISLEAPEGYGFAATPSDVKVSTPNISFTAHWNLSGRTLSVHRAFTSTIDQPLCSGALRKQTAAALKQITDSYDATIQVVSPEGKAKSAKADDTAVQALIESANELAAKKEFEKALPLFERALKLNPQSSWAYNARGAAYMNMEKYDLAMTDFDSALALDPNYEQVFYNRGIIYARKGETKKAVEEFDKALKINSQDAEVLIDRAHAHGMLQQPDRAVQDLDAAIALQPDNWRAHANRAQFRLFKRDTSGALEDCKTAVTNNAKAAWAHKVCADIHLFMGDKTQGITELNTAVSLDPDAWDIRLERAIFLNSNSQPERALSDFDAVLTKQPNNAVALMGRADAHRALKHYQSALGDYDHSIAIKPDNFSAQGSRLITLVEMGRSEQALKDCAQLVANNAGKGWPYLACARAKRALGDDKAANQSVAQAIKLDPALEQSWTFDTVRTAASATKLPPAIQAFAEGSMRFRNGDYTAAAEAFERASKLGMADISVLPQLCQALAHTQRFADTGYQCSRALQLAENNLDLLEARGVAYFRQGKFSEAQKDFDQAFTVSPKEARYLYERGAAKSKAGDVAGGQKDITRAISLNSEVTRLVPKALRL